MKHCLYGCSNVLATKFLDFYNTENDTNKLLEKSFVTNNGLKNNSYVKRVPFKAA